MNSLSKLAAICVCGIVGGILLAFLGVKPLLNTIGSLNQELSRKKIEVKTLEQQIAAFKTAQSDLSKVTDKETIFNTIVDKEDLVGPIQSVEAAAALTDTKQTIKIEEQLDAVAAPDDVVAGHTGITEVPYILSVENDYNGLIRYLKYLEHLPQMTEISKIEFVAESATRDRTTIYHTGQAAATIRGVFFVKSK